MTKAKNKRKDAKRGFSIDDIKDKMVRRNLRHMQKQMDVTITSLDEDTFEMHFTDNRNGSRWRTPKSDMEWLFAFMDRVKMFSISVDGNRVDFIPEEYRG